MLALIAAGCGQSTPTNAPGAGIGTSAAWSTLGNRVAVASPAKANVAQPTGSWQDYNPDAPYPGQSTTLQTITMPDGTQLSAAVTLPADAGGNAVTQPLPTLVTLTGYDKNLPNNTPVSGFLGRHGYAEVLVDVRGTGSSQGDWDMFGPVEQGDDLPILDWVAAQPFCDGNIGLYGESLLAITATLAAAKQHPAVKAAFLKVPMADAYRDIVFTGGQTSASFIPAWFLLVMGGSFLNPQTLADPATGIPLELNQLWHAFTSAEVPLLLRATTGDGETVYDNEFWSSRSPIEHAHDIHVPTFIVGGLQDIFQRGEPLLYEAIKRSAPAKLLIGPWTHTSIGSGLPADGVPVFDHIALQWFDRYLRAMDSGADQLPNVTQYVYGLGHYVTSDDWPHPFAAPRRWYLRGDQSLGAEPPASGEASHATLQQPLNGACSASTIQWTAGLLGSAPLPCFADDALVESLDVKYQTAPLDEDAYINGPIGAELWVSTTAGNATLSVRVDDVDGNTVAPLTNGLQMLSSRTLDDSRSRTLNGQRVQPWHPYTQAAAGNVNAGEPVAVAVEIFPTSALIKAGHRLRVSIGPSDFPRGLPPLPALASGPAGVLTIHSDAEHPSSVVLPLVPAAVLQ
jgi:putative CocE/NonD family hydrolase